MYNFRLFNESKNVLIFIMSSNIGYKGCLKKWKKATKRFEKRKKKKKKKKDLVLRRSLKC